MNLTMTRFGALSALVLGLAAFAGCDSAASTDLGLSVQIYPPAGGSDPFAGVGFLRFAVEGDGMSSGHSVAVPYTASGVANLDDIPYGTGRQVTIEGWTATAEGKPGYVVSRGRSIKAQVYEGPAVQELSVLVAPVNSFTELTDAVGRSVQTLGQGRIGHAIVQTSRHEVVISGGGVLTAPDGQWWGPTAADDLLKSIAVVDEASNGERTHAQSMYFDRIWHTATAYSSGQVILAGGWGTLQSKRTPLKRVEIYNPGADGSVDVLKQDMKVARAAHTATLLDEQGFTILFVGGDDATPCSSSEDCGGASCNGGTCAPSFELWHPNPSAADAGKYVARDLPDGVGRRHHQATLFYVDDSSDPFVLITGGEDRDGNLVSSALVYDVGSDTMIPLPGGLKTGRVHHTSTYVPGRKYIYLAGGYTDPGRTKVTSDITVYDIKSGAFLANVGGFRLKTARGGQSATALRNNGVLFTGGTGPDGEALDSIELVYEFQTVNPDTGKKEIVIAVRSSDDESSVIPSLPAPRFGQRAVTLESGMGLLVGGAEDTGGATLGLPTDLLLYNPE